MSRLYDALKHAENAVVRMIETEQGGQPPASDHIQPVATAEPERLDQPVAPIRTGASVVKEQGYRQVKIRSHAALPVLPFDGTDQRTAECYRILRTNVLHHPAKPRIIAISSPAAGDGKTTSAINIAGVLALKEDSRVLLIDADLRRGTIASKLGIDATPGLAEVLTGACSLEEAIVQTESLANLHILPAGRASLNPVELLDSAPWRAMMQDLRKQFQFTVVDSPPVGVVADYDLIQVVCDGTIVVVRPDHTDRTACTKALQHIAKEKLLGVVLNCAEDWFLWKIRDYDGYYGVNK